MKGLLQRLTGKQPKKKYKLGIALGGGGARGFIHLGVLKGLYERNIKLDIIAGTSAGAIAGVFASAGIDPEKTKDILKSKRVFGYSKLSWPRDGLFSLDGLRKVIEKEIQYTQFEELPIPLIVTVSNLSTGRVEYIEKGPLIDAVLASSSIPVVFKPMTMNGHKYSDGGLLDNLPVKPLRNHCEKIVGVNISPVKEREEIQGILQIAARTFQMSVNAQSHHIKDECTLFIEPEDLRQYDMLDLEKGDELFEIGYDFVKNMDLSKITP